MAKRYTSGKLRLYRHAKSVFVPLFSVICMLSFSSVDARIKTNVSNSTELEYGQVLFEYFQLDYFKALIEQEYSEEINNTISMSNDAQILKGGILLSFGMADDSKEIFDRLLDKANSKKTPRRIKNKAWYYLARFYYLKSEYDKAHSAIGNIKGKIPESIHIDYHYLATLISAKGTPVNIDKKAADRVPKKFPLYAYLVFNQAIEALRNNDLEKAVIKLEQVTGFSSSRKELAILADRARLGLAQLAIRSNNLEAGWKYLKNVSTVGLYSNRALLSYAWAAIKRGQYTEAIPALQLLNDRAIEIPEVQEAKVLLAHLYEQVDAPRKALKSYLLSEKAFKQGVEKVDVARKIIKKRDVPREFITNLQAIMDETAWFEVNPSVDYRKLTPFLIDLMASNAFNETLKELADLYEIHENLSYWEAQTDEHILILNNAAKRTFTADVKDAIEKSDTLKSTFAQQSEEIQLQSLSLDVKDQERLIALLDSVDGDIASLDKTIDRLKSVKTAYRQPQEYGPMVIDHHRRIREQIIVTEKHIAQLEPVMRKLVSAELDKHEERMRYYWAQSRLAKARLYDTTLLELEDAQIQLDQTRNKNKEGVSR